MIASLAACGSPPPPEAPAGPTEDIIGKDSLSSPPVTSVPGDGAPAPGPQPGMASATPPPPPPPATSAPPPPPAVDAQQAHRERFERGVALIRSAVPKWEKGAAAVIRFGDPPGPPLLFEAHDFDPKPSSSIVYLRGVDGTGWVVLAIKQLKAGLSLCLTGTARRPANWKGPDMLVAAATKPDFKGTDPDSLWSDNLNASCLLTMTNARHEGDFEARFRGVLVSNSGQRRLPMREAFFYIRQVDPPKAAQTTTPSAPRRDLAPKPPSAQPAPPRLQLPR